jgi:hypothetical protein
VMSPDKSGSSRFVGIAERLVFSGVTHVARMSLFGVRMSPFRTRPEH